MVGRYKALRGNSWSVEKSGFQGNNTCHVPKYLSPSTWLCRSSLCPLAWGTMSAAGGTYTRQKSGRGEWIRYLERTWLSNVRGNKGVGLSTGFSEGIELVITGIFFFTIAPIVRETVTLTAVVQDTTWAILGQLSVRFDIRLSKHTNTGENDVGERVASSKSAWQTCDRLGCHGKHSKTTKPSGYCLLWALNASDCGLHQSWYEQGTVRRGHPSLSRTTCAQMHQMRGAGLPQPLTSCAWDHSNLPIALLVHQKWVHL